ncbi:calcium-binding protein [Inquilinus limosus]|uniref:calcium-binding protein n=1 Tax=Inquilinus limosus TaxID=171674 RepID=UPI00041782C6|nr:calcium-binding protein [Inquilinus limosus]
MATIEGTPGDDHLVVQGDDPFYSVNPRTGADVIDILLPATSETSIHLEDGGDTVHGGDSWDTIYLSGGGNRLYGGAGNDLFAVSGVGAGNLIDGGSGADTLSAGSADGAFITLAEGRAALRPPESGLLVQYDLRGIENLRDSPGNDILVGDDGPNRLEATGGADLLSGRGGDDVLTSRDDIPPRSSGNDIFVGGRGADTITTAGGADTIRIDRLVESLPGREDVVTDFSAGDILDLSRIDADLTAPGNQAFTFIGTAAFSGTAGELRFERQGDGLLVSADADGDARADMVVVFERLGEIAASDILL